MDAMTFPSSVMTPRSLRNGTHGKETGEKLHGLTHPAVAYENARKYFKLNHTERDIILNHMWPVTLLHFPRTREGWIIVIADKYCGLLETLRLL